MNLALSDEQVFLQEAARDALSRTKTLEAARAALEDPAALPDMWSVAVQAGWPGLLIDEAHGGAELDVFEAMLVAEECGRVLAPVALLGVLPATAILQAAGHPQLTRVASGELRAVWLPARPPSELEPRWTVEPASGMTRAATPVLSREGAAARVSGTVCFVPDATGAQLLLVVATRASDPARPVAAVVDASASGVAVEPLTRYDATRSLATVTLADAPGEVLDLDAAPVLADAWYVAQSLIAAESLGAAQSCLARSVEYARERFTFGRAIGSYQAIKHELVEVLRRVENARGLQYYAGWARRSAPGEFPLAASTARSAAGEALDFAARSMINVHGGTGATWEHDAPLFFRRAELSRRLVGSTRDATDRVAEQTLAAAA